MGTTGINQALSEYSSLSLEEESTTTLLHPFSILATFYLFLSLRRVEFHAEWLRDEPCDATTTGQLVSTGVNSLLVFRGT
jgi:hypothetical protein